MPYYRINAFTLKSRRFMESDRIVTFFSKEKGKIDLVLKGVRRSKSRFGSLAEPFTESLMLFYRKTPDRLGIVQQADIVNPNHRLRNSYKYILVIGYVSELLDFIIGREERDAGVYQLIDHFLYALTKGQDVEKTITVFEWRLLAHEGYRPELYKCIGCNKPLTPPYYFDSKKSTGVYGNCCKNKHDDSSNSITPGCLDFLRKTLTVPLKDTLRFRLKQNTRRSVGLVLKRTVLYHFPELRSKRSVYEKITTPAGDLPATGRDK